MLTGRVLMPTRAPRDAVMAPLYPLSSSSSVSESDESYWVRSTLLLLLLLGAPPSLLFPAVVSMVAEVTELAAVKEFVTEVWVLPVQLVEASEQLLSSSEMASTPPSSLPLPSDEDGSLSSLSKYFSVLFHDATARVRKAGVDAVLVSFLLLLVDEEEALFADIALALVLSDAIFAAKDFFLCVLLEIL